MFINSDYNKLLDNCYKNFKESYIVFDDFETNKKVYVNHENVNNFIHFTDGEFTPLMSAVLEEDISKVKKLLKWGADTEIKNKDGDTALILAACNGFSEIVEFLISPEINANVNAQNDQGLTALMHSVINAYVKTTVLLCKHPSILIDLSDKNGLTALMYAAKYSDYFLVNNSDNHNLLTLLLNKADVNKKDFLGKNALMYATIFGNSNSVKRLLKFGADICSVDNYGINSLMYSVEKLEKLEKKGLDEPLTETLKVIIEKLKEDGKLHLINDQDHGGETALMQAVITNNPDYVQILLENGASLEISSNKRKTAMDLSFKNTKIYKLLNEKFKKNKYTDRMQYIIEQRNLENETEEGEKELEKKINSNL